MKEPLSLKTLLEFMDILEEEGDWLWTDTLVRTYFSGRKDTFYKRFKKFIDAGLIARVAKGVYANPRSKIGILLHNYTILQIY